MGEMFVERIHVLQLHGMSTQYYLHLCMIVEYVVPSMSIIIPKYWWWWWWWGAGIAILSLLTLQTTTSAALMRLYIQLSYSATFERYE